MAIVYAMTTAEEVMVSPRKITIENAWEFISDHDTFMFDCDGVLWCGSDIFSGVVEFTNLLRRMEKKFYFISNNSTVTRFMLLEKILNMGIYAEKDEVLTSAFLAAQYLKNVLNLEDKVYLIGNGSMSEELDEAGINYCGGLEPDPAPVNFSYDDNCASDIDPDVSCVLVGLDPSISFSKILKSTAYLYRRPEVLFVATNEDPQATACGNRVVPAEGGMVSFVKVSCDREPIVVGKPSKQLLKCLSQIDPARTVMIGDRLSTDILFAHNINCTSLMVLTGVHQLEDVERCANSDDQNDLNMVPDYYTPSIGDFNALLSSL